MLRGQLVGFVFQSFQLLPSLTALENACCQLSSKETHWRAKKLSSC